MELNLDEANKRLLRLEPEEIIQSAYLNFRERLVLATSFGAESAIMINMVTKIIPRIPVVFIDTGYHFPETHTFKRELADRFKLNLEVVSAEMSPYDMERCYGNLWEQGDEGKKRYNQLRKIEPMNSKLKLLGAEAVLYGVRFAQTKNRASLRILEQNEQGIYHIHPILRWSDQLARVYMRVHDLPLHPLVEKGYHSIGDTHSTVQGEGRSGRLLGEKMECGLHLRATTHL
jgi:phosphoadenosine phosphosulfate reductase